MGKPVVGQVSGAPPSGDIATDVVSGTLTALNATSSPYVFWGPFNLWIFLSLTADITLTPGAAGTTTLNAGVAAGATQSASPIGQSIAGTGLPAGAFVSGFSSTGLGTLQSVQIGGLTAAQVAALTNNAVVAATFQGPNSPGDVTVVLEKSYDGGATWVAVTNSAGTALSWHLAIANINNGVAFALQEPEKGVAYRLRALTYSSGTVTYRLSDSAPASASWGINSTV